MVASLERYKVWAEAESGVHTFFMTGARRGIGANHRSNPTFQTAAERTIFLKLILEKVEGRGAKQAKRGDADLLSTNG